MADGSRDLQRWHSAADLAGLPGMPGTERRVRARAVRESWQSRNRAFGKGREYSFDALPEKTKAALLLRSAPGPKTAALECNPRSAVIASADYIAALWRRYETCGKSLQDEAGRRLRALQAVDALVAQGTGLLQARALIADQIVVAGGRGSVASLGRWADRVARLEPQHRLAALIPAFCGRTVAAEIDAEAWNLFKADYLRLEQPTATSCHERLQRIARARGWTLPSLRTFERRIEREIPRGVIILRRQGSEALERTFPAQERDRSAFHAIEAVNSDGHKFDVFARSPMGDVVRPILVGVQDLYSGKLVGWRIVETESSDPIRLAFRDLIERYGIPSKAWLDNGRGFASKMITGGTPNRYRFKVREDDPVGILVNLGIEVHWTTPYHGQAKPIERAWRDLCDRIAKHPAFAGAYTGNKPDAKPENYGSKAVPWAEFCRVVNEEIAAHNARIKRRTRICGGIHSFDDVFAASYAQSTIRRATVEQLRQLLLTAEVVQADTESASVRLSGNRYWHEALSPHAGRKLLIRFDPEQLHQAVQIYTLDNVFICAADCIAAVGFADTNAAREHARARKQYLRAIKDQAKAEIRMDAARVAAQLPSVVPPELPAPAVIAPLFNVPRERPVAPVPLARTGTDDGRESALDGHLKRLQERRNAATGFEQPTD